MKTQNLIYILVPLTLMGCSTSQKKVDAKTGVAQAQLEQIMQQYKVSIKTVPESKISSVGCARLTTDVKARWSWKSAVRAADTCLAAHDLAHAEELANLLATREPASSWGPYFLSSVARQRGEMERALWMCELALKRTADVAAFYYLKGQILWGRKDYNTAVQYFERTISIDASVTPAQMFLGQVFFRDQQYAKASKYFYAVLKFEPKNNGALTGLAESQLRDNNPQGAVETYKRLAEYNPVDGQYLSRVGEIYESVLNEPSQALEAYKLLRENVRTSRVKKNIDPQLDAKVRELEQAHQKTRALASTEEKASKVR